MARRRGTTTPTATLVGRLLLLIANGRETPASAAKQLGLSARQVNRYVQQLIDAGWRIERVGQRRQQDYHLRLRSPVCTPDQD